MFVSVHKRVCALCVFLSGKIFSYVGVGVAGGECGRKWGGGGGGGSVVVVVVVVVVGGGLRVD